MSDKFAECVKGKISGPASVVLKTFYDVIKSGLKTKKDIIDALESSTSVPEDKIKHLNKAIEMLNLEYVPNVIVDGNGKMQELKSEAPISKPRKYQACKLYNYMKDLLRNPLFTGVLCAAISVIAYIINNKVKDVENDNSDIVKMGILGACLGLFNGLLMNTLTESSLVINQDFATGTPNF